MKFNIFINYFVDSHPPRNHELTQCLLHNIRNEQIDRITLILEPKNEDILKELLLNNNLSATQKAKVYKIINKERPSYNYYFELTRAFPNDINSVCNSDITFEERSIMMLRKWHWGKYCLALSRWNYLTNDLDPNKSRHYNNRDSQDCWIAKGGFRDIEQANFSLGRRGCDNRIAYLLGQHYIVINPSKTIRTFHYHLTEHRNYCTVSDKDVVKPPYKLLPTQKLP